MNISAKFNSFYHQAGAYCGDYCKDIPKDTLKEAGYIFCVTFAYKAIMTRDLTQAVALGGLNFLTTTIYGLVTPLFKRYMETNRPLTTGEEMLRASIPLLIGAGIVTAATDYCSGLSALKAGALFHLVVSLFVDRTLNHTSAIYMTMAL